MPLLPLSAIVLVVGGSGPGFLGVPVPWLSGVALGSTQSTMEMLQTRALPYALAFIAGVLVGLIVRVLDKPDAAPPVERSIEMMAGPFPIAEKFQLTGRGTVVVVAQTTNLPVGEVLHATIVLPDGSRMKVQAYKEWLLPRTPEPIEKEAYLLLGVEMAQVPPRSTIELCVI